MAEKIKCPKCGYVEQPTPTGKCYKCSSYVTGYPSEEKEKAELAGPEERPASLLGALRNIIRRVSATATIEHGLPGFGAIFEEAWATYKRRFFVLFILFFVSIILASVEHAFYWIIALSFWESETFKGVTIDPAMRLMAIAGIISFLVLAFWSQAAFIFAVSDESLRMKGAIVKGFQRLGSYVLLFMVFSVISVFVVMAVIILFMLAGFVVRSMLFFLPEIIGRFLFGMLVFIAICIWFVFAFFVCIVFATEDRGAIDALSKSAAYLRGLWFGMFKKVLFIPIVLFIANIPAGYLLYRAATSFDYPGLVYKLLYAANAAAVLINSIFVPFLAIFVYKVYKQAKILKGERP
ncbi:MAG: hypothetical protein P8013_14975 [Candidatus Sulfobium sp.]|jgi:preprotein translocase subunit Sec61beta